MLFAGGQAVEGAGEVVTGEAQGFLNRDFLNHLGERGTAGERRGTAVGEEACGFDAPGAQTQREAETVAADGVGLFGDDEGNGVIVGGGEFADVAGVGEVVFECL